MAKISKTYEKLTNKHQLLVIELVADISDRDEAGQITINDVKANLYINHKFIADISPVLSTTPAFENMVDDINWDELYCDHIAALAEDYDEE